MQEAISKKSVVELLCEINDRIKNEPCHDDSNGRKGKYNINMLETFWLLHGNYDKIQQELPQLNLSGIINKAINNYEQIFEQEAKAFVASKVDYILDFIDKFTKETEYYPKSSKHLMLLSKTITSIKTWVDTYVDFTSDYEHIFEKFDIPWSLNKALNPNENRFSPSMFPGIIRRLNTKNKIVYFSDNPEQYQEIKHRTINKKTKLETNANTDWLTNEYNSIIANLFEIFNLSEEDFNSIQKQIKQISRNIPETEKLLISMKYAIDSGINYELLTIYLFINKDKSCAPWTNMISQKHELFIQRLYDILIAEKSSLKELFNIYYERSIIEKRKEFSLNEDLGYSSPLTFFKLHKIFVLYRAIVDPMILEQDHKNDSFHLYPKSVSNTIRDYIKIFNHSSLIYPCYNIFISYPPMQILNDYVLTIPEAAKLMGVNKSTLNRVFEEKKALQRKHMWFWLALSGCTHEFLDGLTSIPFYGSDSSNDCDCLQRIAPVIFCGIAENIIKNLTDISEYINSLGRNYTKKLDLISSKHQEEITKRCTTIAELIRKKRCMIETEIYNKQLDAKAKNEDPIIIRDDNLKTLSQNFTELISILDQTIKALKDCTPD